jgi:hypothetical protein
MTARSNRADVRNPVLSLPALRALRGLDPRIRALLATLLKDLQHDARTRAQKSWDTRKPALASYWAAVGVYAGHLAKAVRPDTKARGRHLTFTVRQSGYPDLPVAGWADASRLSQRQRVRAYPGVNCFPACRVLIDGIPVARIDDDGRVWPLGAPSADMQPIYDSQNVET